MKNEQWKAVHTVFEKMERLCTHLQQPVPAVQAASSPVESDARPQTEQTGLSGEARYDLVGIRAEIRKELDLLRVKLAEQLTERDCYLVIFPIVSYFDEYIQTHYLDENRMSWPSLQKELFQIDDAGQLFYDTVDDILRKPQTLPFIYEVYYFCMGKGFQGRYVDNAIKINEYMKKLGKKISVRDLESAQTNGGGADRIKRVGSPVWYYVASTVVLIAAYIALRVSANYWDLGF